MASRFATRAVVPPHSTRRAISKSFIEKLGCYYRPLSEGKQNCRQCRRQLNMVERSSNHPANLQRSIFKLKREQHSLPLGTPGMKVIERLNSAAKK
jgi:hypothetical protein